MFKRAKAWFQSRFFGVKADERIEPWVPTAEHLTTEAPYKMEPAEGVAFQSHNFVEYPVADDVPVAEEHPFVSDPISTFTTYGPDLNAPVAETVPTCPECGGPMPTQTGPGRPRKYCSDTCTNAAWNRKRRDAREAAKTFKVTPSEGYNDTTTAE